MNDQSTSPVPHTALLCDVIQASEADFYNS